MAGRKSALRSVEFSGLTILYIVKDSMAVMAVKKQLAQSDSINAELITAENIQTGVALLLERKFDLVLLDLNLKDINGAETYEKLCRDVPVLPPVIVISDSEDRELTREVLRDGAQDFILKKDLVNNSLITSIEHTLWRLEPNKPCKPGKKVRPTPGETTNSQPPVHSIINVSTEAMIIVDEDSLILFVNPAAIRMLGRDKKDLIGKPFEFPVSTDTIAQLSISRETGKRGVAEMRTVEINWNGQSAYLVSLHDITSHINTERKIQRFSCMQRVLSGINNLVVRVRHRQELLAGVTQIAVAEGGLLVSWVGIVDLQNRGLNIISWHGGNPSFKKSIANHIKNTLKEDPQKSVYGNILAARKLVVINNVSRDKRINIKQDHLSLGIKSCAYLPIVLNGKAEGVVALYAEEKDFFGEEEVKLLLEMVGDISFALSYIEKAKKLDYLANYDPVTNLPNRMLLEDRLTQAIQFADRYQLNTAVLFIDLDRFKSINDTYGHTCGDEALKIAADRIRMTVRGADTVARQGGDEFVVVLAGNQSNEGDITSTAQRIVDVFSKPMMIDGSELAVTCSVGVAMYSGGGTDPKNLLRNADTAMYRAKERGGNNFRLYRVAYNKQGKTDCPLKLPPADVLRGWQK